MKQIPLAAVRRETTGKGPAHQMRVAGQIPAVIYSAGKDSEKLAVERRDLEKMLRQAGGSAFLSLSVDDEAPRLALLQEMQHDYMGKNVIHIDFYQIRADQEITVEVPVELTGEAKGIIDGGLVSQNLHNIVLKGRIADIPDVVEVDVTDLGLGDNIHSDNLALPENVSLGFDESILIVLCASPNSGPSGGEAAGGAEPAAE